MTATTPLWVPILVAAFGFISTVLGIVITQVMANRRERENWKRELKRQRTTWAREDQARTFEQRRELYVSFYEILQRTLMVVHDFGCGISKPRLRSMKLPWNWQMEALTERRRLELFASPEVTRLAKDAYEALFEWGHATRWGRRDAAFFDGMKAASDASVALVQGIRADLHVPGGKDDQRSV